MAVAIRETMIKLCRTLAYATHNNDVSRARRQEYASDLELVRELIRDLPSYFRELRLEVKFINHHTVKSFEQIAALYQNNCYLSEIEI